MTHPLPGAYSPTLQSLVAASLLRSGTDTRAALLFKALPRDTPDPVRALATAIEPRADRRPALVNAAMGQAERALGQAGACGAALLTLGQEGYPPRLAEIADPPIVLWTTGDPGLLLGPAVALVGSRRATTAGLATARSLGRDLARAGLTVVSGLARGIDAAAHQGALEVGGRTVAVLGCGVDVVYPREHRELVAGVRSTGCLVSELAPGTPPLPRHFPLRNRLISGLSLAVVVVEAAQRSGSLITARMALEQGRDVLAVPGAVVSGCHRGCHALIKDGAGLVETADDVLAAVGWPGAAPSRPGPGGGLVGAMRVGEPVSADDLAAQVSRPPGQLLAELAELELAGRVARMPGGLYVRLD